MHEISCRITAAFLSYIRNTRREFLEPLLRGLPYDEGYLSNPDNWIPLEIERTLEDRLVELFQDERILFQIGKSVLSLKSLGIVNIIFNLFVTPERLIRYSPKIARYFTKDMVQVTVKESSRNSAVVALTVKGRQTRGACLFNQGLFSLASELFGQGETRITEEQCMVPVHELGKYQSKSYEVDDSHNVIEHSCGNVHRAVGRLSDAGTYAIDGTLFGAESCIFRMTWDSKPFAFRRGTAGRRKALEEALLHLEENYLKLQQTYDSLWKSEEKYRELMENASDIICFIDTDGRIVALNKKGTELTGYIAEEVRGRDVLSFVEEQDRDMASVRLRESLNGSPDVIEVSLNVKNGGRLILSVNSTPVMEDGRITGAMLIARDITTEREIAARLIEAERFAAKGMVAAEIAHEINNSLANIETAMYILNTLRVGREYRQDVLKDVHEEIERMSGIVKGILEVYRADDSVIQSVDINAEIEKIMHITQRRLSGNGIALVCERYPDLSPVPCYPGHVKQVLLNLIKNAEEAMVSCQKKVIVISTGETEDSVRMTVSDTGCGISGDDMKKIFTPLLTSKPGGTGIGLAICREIIKRYNGDIQVQSEEGKGTSVTVLFPKTVHG